jgi:hypothetical protein
LSEALLSDIAGAKYFFQTGLLFLCAAPTFAQNTVPVMDSEPGDYIGRLPARG